MKYFARVFIEPTMQFTIYDVEFSCYGRIDFGMERDDGEIEVNCDDLHVDYFDTMWGSWEDADPVWNRTYKLSPARVGETVERYFIDRYRDSLVWEKDAPLEDDDDTE